MATWLGTVRECYPDAQCFVWDGVALLPMTDEQAHVWIYEHTREPCMCIVCGKATADEPPYLNIDGCESSQPLCTPCAHKARAGVIDVA